MPIEINDSKEEIKRRMLKHTMNFYDIKNGNENDLDPIVKLIIDGLSLELYNLGNDVVETQVRVLEKIANLLTPDFLTCPNPAHSIMHALPIEPVEKLNDKTVFFTQKKISSKNDDVLDTSVSVHFTPVDSVRIIDGQVSFALTGNKVFKYDSTLNRQLVPSKGEIAEANSLWLGLKVNKEITDINNLHFCFDWKNIDPQSAFRIYQLLPLTKWYMNDLEVKIKTGLPYVENSKQADLADSIFLDYNLLSLIKKDIKNFYDPKFITVAEEGLDISESKEKYPPVFRDYFKEAELQKYTEPLLWIKIVFPAGLKQELIDEVNIHLNVFPVINRKLTDKKYRLKTSSNIIPLETNEAEQFLAVEAISDESNVYKSVPYRKTETEEMAGTYSLRNGGVERFDSRNAKEFISYLLESLRNESIAFSAFGLDNISTLLKEINQRIALIELKTAAVNNSAVEIPNYIIVKPFEGKDLMYVEYWSTLAEVANNMRSGSRLQQFSGTKVKPDSLILLAGTMGGKSRLSPKEKLNAFKYGMMTRNRIITKEDISNFCYYELGSSINKLTIEKGFQMSPDTQQGFSRTIDITIYPSKKAVQNTEEWQILCEQLRIKLHTRSGMSNNYRVLIKN